MVENKLFLQALVIVCGLSGLVDFLVGSQFFLAGDWFSVVIYWFLAAVFLVGSFVVNRELKVF